MYFLDAHNPSCECLHITFAPFSHTYTIMILADKASGVTQTPHYKCVQNNYARLTAHLRTNPQAKKQLFEKFVAEDWHKSGDCPNENVLINIALDRIKQDSKEYSVFISMLERVPATDIIVKDLKGAF